MRRLSVCHTLPLRRNAVGRVTQNLRPSGPSSGLIGRGAVPLNSQDEATPARSSTYAGARGLTQRCKRPCVFLFPVPPRHRVSAVSDDRSRAESGPTQGKTGFALPSPPGLSYFSLFHAIRTRQQIPPVPRGRSPQPAMAQPPAQPGPALVQRGPPRRQSGSRPADERRRKNRVL